jgi:hypothetical protein
LKLENRSTNDVNRNEFLQILLRNIAHDVANPRTNSAPTPATLQTVDELPPFSMFVNASKHVLIKTLAAGKSKPKTSAT